MTRASVPILTARAARALAARTPQARRRDRESWRADTRANAARVRLESVGR